MCWKREEKRGCEAACRRAVTGVSWGPTPWEMALPEPPPASSPATAPLLWVAQETVLLLGEQSLAPSHVLRSQHLSYVTGVCLWRGSGAAAWTLQPVVPAEPACVQLEGHGEPLYSVKEAAGSFVYLHWKKSCFQNIYRMVNDPQTWLWSASGVTSTAENISTRSTDSICAPG